MRKNKQYHIGDYWLNFFLLALFLLPQNEVLYYTVPLGMLILTDWKRKPDNKLSSIVLLIIVLLGVSLLTNLSKPWVDTKSYFKAMQFIVCLIAFGKLKSLRIMKGTLVILILYLALFQFAGIFHISLINSISSYLYPLTDKTEMLNNYVSEMDFSGIGADARLFGIYRNSNNCALYWQIILLLLLIEKDTLFKKPKDNLAFYTLLLLTLGGIVAAGSRTSFLVLIATILIYFNTNNSKAIFRVIIPLALFVGIVFFYGSELRMFRVEEGMSGSFELKLAIISRYIETDLDTLSLLFGRFTTKALVPLLNTVFSGTDSDVGDMFVRYGIISLIVWGIFLTYVFLKLDKRYRVFFCIFLWVFSNTVLVNYRTSTILLLVLNIYYCRKLLNSSKL